MQTDDLSLGRFQEVFLAISAGSLHGNDLLYFYIFLQSRLYIKCKVSYAIYAK